MLEFLQAIITINLGLIFLILDLIGLAAIGDLIIDAIVKRRNEGKSTTLDEDEHEGPYR